MVALSKDEHLSAAGIFAALAATMTVFWLAHVYAGAVEQWMEHGHRPRRAEMRRVVRATWPMLEAAGTSLAALALGALGLLSRDAAVWLAIVLGIVDLCAWGWRAGRRSASSVSASLTLAALSGCFALPIVALKVLVH